MLVDVLVNHGKHAFLLGSQQARVPVTAYSFSHAWQHTPLFDHVY